MSSARPPHQYDSPRRPKDIAKEILELHVSPAASLIPWEDDHMINVPVWHTRYLSGRLPGGVASCIDRYLFDDVQSREHWDSLTEGAEANIAGHIAGIDDIKFKGNPVERRLTGEYTLGQCLRDEARALKQWPQLKESGNELGMRTAYAEEMETLRKTLVALSKNARVNDSALSILQDAPRLAGLIAKDVAEVRYDITRLHHTERTDLADTQQILQDKLPRLITKLIEAVEREKGQGRGGNR